MSEVPPPVPPVPPPPGPPPMPPYGVPAPPNDESTMSILVILWKVWAGLTAVGGCCAAGYFAFGAALMAGSASATSSSMPGGMPPAAPETAVVGGFFAFIGILMLALMAGIGVLNWLAGTWIQQRRNYVGVVVLAAIACLSVPLGTGLGIFTFVMITKPHIKAEFDANA